MFASDQHKNINQTVNWRCLSKKKHTDQTQILLRWNKLFLIFHLKCECDWEQESTTAAAVELQGRRRKRANKFTDLWVELPLVHFSPLRKITQQSKLQQSNETVSSSRMWAQTEPKRSQESLKCTQNRNTCGRFTNCTLERVIVCIALALLSKIAHISTYKKKRRSRKRSRTVSLGRKESKFT